MKKSYPKRSSISISYLFLLASIRSFVSYVMPGAFVKAIIVP